MSFEYLMKNYNIYPNILEYGYFTEPIPKDLHKYEYVFIDSDIPVVLPVNIVQLHTSPMRGDGMYSWFREDISYINPFEPLPMREQPTIGFVGRIPIFEGNKLHQYFEFRYYPVNDLIKSNEIGTDFHIRTQPIGESASFWDALPLEMQQKDRYLFESNMLANHYQLCPRGNGNRSRRFYETLAYGRIPVYIESNGYIAFGNFIDYFSGDIPFVFTDMKNAVNELLDFHENHDIRECQCLCRQMYDDYFSHNAQTRLFNKYCNEIRFRS